MIDRKAEAARINRDVSALVPNPGAARRVFYGAREIQSRSWSGTPNWSLVMTLYGVGSTYAWEICRRMKIDPDAYTVSEAYLPEGQESAA